MAESLINSIARLRVIEKRLLTKELVSRLKAAPGYPEAVKALREAGFGAGFDKEGGDELEGLVSAHLAETYALVGELMPERLAFVTDIFRMRHDLTNIKLLYKKRLMGEPLEGAKLDEGGIFSGLAADIAKGDYSRLPKPIGDALADLDVRTYKNPDARLVSDTLDGAYISMGLASRSAFVREYFRALADFTNLLALVRGAEGELPKGEYGAEELEKVKAALRTEPEKIPALLKTPFDASPLKEAARAGFEAYLKSGRVSALESARDEYLISLASKGRSEIDSPAPIVGFMLAREREAEVVRLILTVKRSGLPAGVLDERSVTLYG